LVRNRQSWKSETEAIEGSVTNLEPWKNDERLKDLKGIFHLAAIVQHSRKNPEEMYHTNIEGTLNMVRLAASKRCRLIFVSTSGTVGCFRSPEEWADENSPYCEKEVSSWPYYDSKIKAEKQAIKLAKELSVELVIVRPPVLLGPGDIRLRSTGIVMKFLKRKFPFLVRGGIHFVDVRDVTQALVKIMSLASVRPVYHFSGTTLSLKEFFQILEKVSGVKRPSLVLPSSVARILAKTLDVLPLSFLPDPVLLEMATKFWNIRSLYAKSELGFAARNPEETLADTVKWLSQTNHFF